jgi:hypothetical protein
MSSADPAKLTLIATTHCVLIIADHKIFVICVVQFPRLYLTDIRKARLLASLKRRATCKRRYNTVHPRCLALNNRSVPDSSR